MTVFTKTTTAASVLLLLSTMALGQISDDSIAVETLVVAPAEEGVEFTINATEWVRYTYFELEGPRLVVDFHNAENALGFLKKEVSHAGVNQVRASFFTDDSREVTRLVFDLQEEIPFEVIDDGAGQVRVRFGVNDDWAVQAPGADSGGRLTNLPTEDTPIGPGPSADASLILATYEPTQTETMGKVLPAVDVHEVAHEVAHEVIDALEVDEVVAVGDGTLEIAEFAADDDREASLVPIAAPVLTSAVETVSLGQGLLASISERAEFEIGVAPAAIVVEALGSPVPAGVDPGSLARLETAGVPPRSNAEAPAETVPVAGIAAAPPPSAFLSQTVEPSPTPQYTGEIATFDFRDLDLQDFFRLIGDISGLNVVLDPAVNGTVTLLLRAVPWDQALDVVLRNNNLGYELEGNILRVATRATLQAEEDAARLLREAQELNAPLMTETYILSYTQSATVLAIVQDLLSPRGTIITDARRNALIITDIPSQFGRVGSLISFLDTPSQQVEIEARLLSASKSFSRDLGTQIGLLIGNNSQNAVTGLPGTGSPFARTPVPGVNVGGALPLISDFPAGGTSGLSFLLGAGGDILLDTIIQAAEATGTAKLLSRPRITTQNNQSATVSQGTQIPVQTNVNNTITVTFVDFSLSLTVTPQITEAGTILLMAAIENSSPEFGRSVNGIPSVSSQQATTQVLIPDGGTAVIGGILLDNDSVNVSQVPGLGNIPVLGNLFKSTQVIKSTSELLFFITARIKPANPLEFLSATTSEESSQLFAQ